jgi:anti-sigma B factor antagonist
MSPEPPPIRVHVEHEEVIVVAPVGELDVFTSTGLRDLLPELLSYEPQDVVVDLSRVSFLDCSALRILVDAGRQLDAYGGRLTVRGATDFQRLTMRLLRAEEVVRLVP